MITKPSSERWGGGGGFGRNPVECTVVVVTPLPDAVFNDLAGKTSELIPCLDALQFRNGPSFVYANQSFGWQRFCGLYVEAGNVSTIRYGWDALEQWSYLFENPGDPKKQRSPPKGMRSAVPLGGLGKANTEFQPCSQRQFGSNRIVPRLSHSFQAP